MGVNLMSLIDFTQSIWDGFVYLFYACFYWVLSGVVLCVGYPFYYIFKGLLDVVYLLVSVLSFGTYLADLVTQLSGLPDALRYLLLQCGVPQGLTIVCTAIGLRMLINLIPSWATRI